MSVLFDITFRGVVFSHHTGHIPDPYDFAADGVAEDNLIGYLLLRVFCRLNMNGCLLAVGIDAATHGGQTLCLQLCKEHLLSNAVGLQALTVYVERDLFFLFTKHLHAGHRGDAP